MTLMHQTVAEQTIETLKDFNEATKIILFGSVSRREHTSKSDVDIAFICSDGYRSILLDDEGLPYGLMQRVTESVKPIRESYGIPLHISFYWDTEFANGISLGRDLLNKVGKLVYDRESTLS